MTLASETESPEQAAAAPEPGRVRDPEFPYEVEMTLMEHLEELRSRLLASVIAVVICIIACFAVVNRIVALLEVPAQGVTFLQLAPGEYFFVSVKVAAYSGLLLATPFLLYQIARFVLPGLSVKERKLLGPVVLGSSLLFVAGLVFAYYLLIPAALNFFIRYGEGVVDQAWSIDRYFEFVLLLLFSTGLAFQVPDFAGAAGGAGGW
jgi:sec-independent protein translocase protein TatC